MTGGLDFSIILPVCHGGDFFKKALGSLGRLDFPPGRFEVLFAGPDSNEDLRRKVESGEAGTNVSMKYIGADQSNRSAWLNAAISQARGRILVFADDDCVFLPDWLHRLNDVFEREDNIGVAGGFDRAGTNEPPFNIALDYVLNSFAGTGGLRRSDGPRVGKYYPKLWNMAVLREVAFGVAIRSREGTLKVFNETLDVHEDVELTERIEKTGRRIIYAPDVVVMHSRDTTLGSFIRRSFKMARIARSLKVHQLPHILLMIFSVGVCTLALFSTVFQSVKIALGIVLGAYMTILLVSAAGVLRQTGKLSVVPYVPLLLVSLHFSRGLGFIFPGSIKTGNVRSYEME